MLQADCTKNPTMQRANTTRPVAHPGRMGSTTTIPKARAAAAISSSHAGAHPVSPEGVGVGVCGTGRAEPVAWLELHATG